MLSNRILCQSIDNLLLLLLSLLLLLLLLSLLVLGGLNYSMSLDLPDA